MERAGLLEAAPLARTPDILFEAVILGGAPPWLPDADLLVQDPAEIPEDALSAAEALGVGPTAALACIHRAWGKVDTESRREVGDAGELEVLRHLSTRPGVTVDHVAGWSDAFGYDIAVLDGFRSCHLEVKATTRENRLSLYLSRNEFETMRADPSWSLAMVVLNRARQLAKVYSIDRAWIQMAAPADTPGGGRWSSARFDIPEGASSPGIPALAPFIDSQSSPLLTGSN